MSTAPCEPMAVQNGGRKLTFTGRLLARVSSERRHAPRWTVMELFRTERGVYVVHRVGVSRVYHTPDCSMAAVNRLPYGHELPDGAPSVEQMANLAPCSDCRPLPTDPSEQLRFERERHWAGVADTADAAVEMMYRTDQGKRSLPWIAVSLLAEAAVSDPDIAYAYQTERI